MNPVQDYVEGVHKFAEMADYLVINISSPNTPGIYICIADYLVINISSPNTPGIYIYSCLSCN